MSTPKIGIENFVYNETVINTLLDTAMQKIDDFMPTVITGTVGETVSQYDAVYMHTDGKFYKAIADGAKMPAWGLMYEAGSADDVKRIQILDEMTNSGWSWTPGQKLYLSTTVSGGLTSTAPGSNIQLVGMAKASNQIHLTIFPGAEDLATINYVDNALTTLSGLQDSALDTHKSSSDHDGRYYTEDEVDTLIATTVSGWTGSIPTISGTITVVNGLITNYV